MNVPAEKVTEIINLIEVKWKVGPTCLAESTGYSRQTIHTWKKKGASEKQYAKLEHFLKTGPDLPAPTHGDQFVITLNLKLDVANPTDEAKAAIAKAISLLQSISKSWTE